MDFQKAFELLIGNEGVYSDDPNDRGNWTGGRINTGELKGSKYGISAAAYPALDIKNLTLEDARRIYYRDYWGPAGCDAVPDQIKFDLFDFAVNSGPRRAIKLLQLAIGAVDDGVLGPKTMMAINNYHPALLRLRLQGQRMMLMVQDPTWATQGRGWMIRLAKNALREVV
jgi:lysozyme family protein